MLGDSVTQGATGVKWLTQIWRERERVGARPGGVARNSVTLPPHPQHLAHNKNYLVKNGLLYLGENYGTDMAIL